MSGSTSLLDLIATAQAQKEVTANALFDAACTAMLFGRRASTSSLLTWGYYGGVICGPGTSSDDNLLLLPNGTVALTASDTNYIEADADGVVTANTAGWTPGSTPLYEVVTGADTVTSYTDWRVSIAGLVSQVKTVNGMFGDVLLTAADIEILDAGNLFDSTVVTVEDALQELGAALGGLGSGTVTHTGGALTQYAVMVGAGGDDAAVLASLGTAGQVLQSAGAGANPAWTSQPWDAHAGLPGVPAASAYVLPPIPVARAVAFPANFAGSYGTATVAATASTAFDLTKNGTTIGTATFVLGATTATFTTVAGAAQTLAAGDVLAITAPGTPDATLANVGFVLAGTR